MSWIRGNAPLSYPKPATWTMKNRFLSPFRFNLYVPPSFLMACSAFPKDKPDIVFLDVIMPEMDGIETLQTIKERYPDIAVIMITGNPSKENVEESIQSGASGFIVKPFNSAKVLNTLDRAWQSRKPPLEQRDD